MSRLHICNTFFERELESASPHPLAEWMRSNAVIRRLQTLPLLYAAEEDFVLVSHLPEHPDPRLRLLEDAPSSASIEDWGPSLATAAWAEKRGIPYDMPDWDLVKEISSKAFSFSNAPRLAGSALLCEEKEVLNWIATTRGPKVLKTCFGTAGQGHFHVGKSKNLAFFLIREFGKGLPLIGEPWVERVLDFSTQWKNGELLGATICENTPDGVYKGTLAGPKQTLFSTWQWALEEHLSAVQPLIAKIQALGFFGHLGIDAYVYLSQGKEKLQPIVEINGRKTMGWAALQVQQKQNPDTCLRFSFSPSRGISFENWKGETSHAR